MLRLSHKTQSSAAQRRMECTWCQPVKLVDVSGLCLAGAGTQYLGVHCSALPPPTLPLPIAPFASLWLSLDPPLYAWWSTMGSLTHISKTIPGVSPIWSTHLSAFREAVHHCAAVIWARILRIVAKTPNFSLSYARYVRVAHTPSAMQRHRSAYLLNWEANNNGEPS